MADVAAALALTPGHLTTLVRRKTGRTVQQWITQRRMQQARRLLTETDAAVAVISRRVGYPDVSYFIKRFRAEHGVTRGSGAMPPIPPSRLRPPQAPACSETAVVGLRHRRPAGARQRRPAAARRDSASRQVEATAAELRTEPPRPGCRSSGVG